MLHLGYLLRQKQHKPHRIVCTAPGSVARPLAWHLGQAEFHNSHHRMSIRLRIRPCKDMHVFHRSLLVISQECWTSRGTIYQAVQQSLTNRTTAFFFCFCAFCLSVIAQKVNLTNVMFSRWET